VQPSGQISTLTRTGAALGVFEEAQYQEREIVLQKGETLLFYTDGLTDAINANNEEFGLERMQRVTCQVRTQPAAHIQAAIIAAMSAHVGATEAFDDITMVVVKRDA
jgi:sigma-B regulation protein RsbU (phosphoserine phosphatase)